MKKHIPLLLGLSLLAAACTPQTPAPVEQPRPATFENNFMKITLSAGWAAKNVSSSAAVNITKDNFILYINPQASQASGVMGGRFAEIAAGSPSADAVITVQPSNPCGFSQQFDLDSTWARTDLYVSTQDRTEYCVVPANGKTVWYFSYVNTKGPGGYFNYYKEGEPKAYVITMSYNSPDVNSFPEKDSPALTAALTEMSAMVRALELKAK